MCSSGGHGSKRASTRTEYFCWAFWRRMWSCGEVVGPSEVGETWMRRATSFGEEEEELAQRGWALAPYTPECTRMCWKRSAGIVETGMWIASVWVQ